MGKISKLFLRAVKGLITSNPESVSLYKLEIRQVESDLPVINF